MNARELVYIVCDRCGYLRTSDDAEPGAECPQCASPAAWLFQTFEPAYRFQRQVLDKKESVR